MVAKDYSMLFNSVAFVFLFFPVVFLLYSGIDRLRFKRKNEVLNFLLVAFSLVFYCWGGIKPLWGLLVLIAWNYGMGLLSALFSPRQDEPRASKAKKLVLMTGIVGNVVPGGWPDFSAKAATAISSVVPVFSPERKERNTGFSPPTCGGVRSWRSCRRSWPGTPTP